MKTNALAFLGILILLSSCTRTESIEDETTETPFFNLKVGNEWVYKTYDRKDFTSELKATGEVDSIKIVSTVTLNGKNYFKVENINRRPPNYSPSRTVSYNYWRLNDKGHLVSLSSYYFDQGNSSDAAEFVKHAGNDNAYSYTDNSQYGDVVYKLYPKTNVTINNQNHDVIPYNGQFTPKSQFPNMIPKVQENNYKEGVGLVKSICHTFDGTYNFEQHLESYSLK